MLRTRTPRWALFLALSGAVHLVALPVARRLLRGAVAAPASALDVVLDDDPDEDVLPTTPKTAPAPPPLRRPHRSVRPIRPSPKLRDRLPRPKKNPLRRRSLPAPPGQLV